MVFAALSARLKPCPFKAGFMQPVLAGESYAIGAHFAGCGKDTVGALFSVFNALIAPESAVALADGQPMAMRALRVSTGMPASR